MAVLEQARTVSSADRAVRSSPFDVLIVVLVLGFGFLGLRPLRDPDVWWHLRTGELVVDSGFTTTDPWSYASTKPWVLHEWGTEVLMYLSYAAGGYRGVIALHALGMLTLGALLLRSIRREASVGVAITIGILAILGVLKGVAERPQLVTWCLLAATLPALQRAVRERRPPWWFVPVVGIWANLHGMWSVGLVLYGFLVLGLLLDVGLRQWRDWGRFAMVGVACAAAACVNPHGPSILLTPLQVREYAPFVSEWRPPDLLGDPYYASAFLLLGIIVIGWARTRESISKPEIAYVVGAVFVGLPYARTVPVLAIALAPLAARYLTAMRGSRVTPFLPQRELRVVSAVLAVVAVLGAAAWLPQVPGIARRPPTGASAYVDDLPGRAKVLNAYTLGGWMLWTARDSSPAIDGRTEIYAPDYVRRASGAVRLDPGWQKFVTGTDFDAAWLLKGSPLIYGLKTRGWTVGYEDDGTVVLLPPPPAARS